MHITDKKRLGSFANARKKHYKELQVGKTFDRKPGNADKELQLQLYMDQLWKNYKWKVSVPTIIDRAKKNDFYILKKEHKSHEGKY